MKQQKLNYRFHNPNTPEETAEFLFRLFIEVNKNKVERALRAAAEEMEKEEQALSQVTSTDAAAPAKESVCKKIKQISSDLPITSSVSTKGFTR